MYQHLTQAAKDVLKLSQTMAHLGHLEFVGTEHILLALMEHGQGAAVEILKNHGIKLHHLQEKVHLLVKTSSEDTWVVGRLPGSPHFQHVVALAIEEAEKFKAGEVGTEYLLLGLLHESGCIAEKALRELGLTYKDVVSEIASLRDRPLTPDESQR